MNTGEIIYITSLIGITLLNTVILLSEKLKPKIKKKLTKVYLITYQKPGASPECTYFRGESPSRFILLENSLGRNTVLLHHVEIHEDEADEQLSLLKQLRKNARN